MKSEELLLPEISNLNPTQYPSLIYQQVSLLNECSVSVKNALENAKKAKIQAEKAKNKSAGLFQKKVAIKELQTAVYDNSIATESLAEAQSKSYELQSKMAHIAKYLFELGIRDIALNRIVVRELELRLKGASEKEISDLARQEILVIVKQLKEQEDILLKQNNLSDRVNEHNIKWSNQERLNKLLEIKEREQKSLFKTQGIQIKALELIDNQIFKKISDQEEKLNRQNKIIDESNKQIKNQNHTFNQSFDKINKNNENLLERVLSQNKEIYNQIDIIKDLSIKLKNQELTCDFLIEELDSTSIQIKTTHENLLKKYSTQETDSINQIVTIDKLSKKYKFLLYYSYVISLVIFIILYKLIFL